MRLSSWAMIVRASAGLALGSLTAGCSAIVLGHEIYDCVPLGEVATPDAGMGSRIADCEALNRRDDRDALSCERWTCDREARRCRFGPRDLDGDGALGAPPAGCQYEQTDCDDRDGTRLPGAPDDCDGRDNDCDLAIDEDTTGANYVDNQPLGSVSGALPSSLELASASVGDEDLVLLASPAGFDAPATLVRAGGSAVAATWAYTCGSAEVNEGCVGRYDCTSGACRCVGRTCDFAQPSLSTVGGRSWLATVSSSPDCPDGQVQVGEIVGATVRVNHAPDATREYGFPACDVGARFPALVGGTNGDLALVTTLAEPASSVRACGEGSVVVRARVLQLGGRMEPGYVSALGGDLDLGSTRSSRPVASVALGAGEWLVAFSSVSGGVVLSTIDSTGGGVRAEVESVGAGPDVRVVATREGSEIRGLLGWLDTCGSGRAHVARFVVNGPVARVEAAIELASEASNLQLTATSERFVEPGWERGGSMPEAGALSGWIVAWSNAGGVAGARILSADGQPIGQSLSIFDGASRLVAMVPESGPRLARALRLTAAAELERARIYCRMTEE